MKRRLKAKKIRKRSSRSGEKLLETINHHIPLDLMVEILTKLPLKSLGRFRCVSKPWSSLVNDSIKIRSLTQPPCLLVMFFFNGSTDFCSSTYPLKTNTTFVSTNQETNHTLDRHLMYGQYGYLRGLMLFKSRIDQFVIYNLTTKQSVLLPQVRYDHPSRWYIRDGFLAYDPVENQYKVLCFVRWFKLPRRSTCLVFKFPSPDKEEWRNVDDFTLPSDGTSKVCINGIIYYIGSSELGNVLVSFRVRPERLHRIQFPEALLNINVRDLTLLNYQEKLGCISYSLEEEGAYMWIMEEEDIEKQEWSKIILFIPPHVLKIRLHYCVAAYFIAGVSRNGEIVLMPSRFKPAETFYAYFYDPKQNKTTRVELESTLQREATHICSEPDHFENTMDLVLTTQ